MVSVYPEQGRGMPPPPSKNQPLMDSAIILTKRLKRTMIQQRTTALEASERKRSRPLSLLFVTTKIYPEAIGGRTVYLHELAHALAKRGVHITILAGRVRTATEARESNPSDQSNTSYPSDSRSTSSTTSISSIRYVVWLARCHTSHQSHSSYSGFRQPTPTP